MRLIICLPGNNFSGQWFQTLGTKIQKVSNKIACEVEDDPPIHA